MHLPFIDFAHGFSSPGLATPATETRHSARALSPQKAPHQSANSRGRKMFSSEHYTPDRRSDLSKRDRRPNHYWVEPDLVLIVGVMAAVMALLVFTLHSYSPTLTAVPQISTSEPTTTGQGH